jgi:hypothetical protein
MCIEIILLSTLLVVSTLVIALLPSRVSIKIDPTDLRKEHVRGKKDYH